jgi:hypothetical protein
MKSVRKDMSHFTTGGKSACVDVEPHFEVHDRILAFVKAVKVLWLRGVLSDERACLSLAKIEASRTCQVHLQF